MGNAESNIHIDVEIKEDLQNNEKQSAAAKIQEYLDRLENVPLNIAITGETGSGKSTFINAIRGLKNKEEGAAPVGRTETTMKVTEYLHPNFPNVTLYDLPGVGSTNFPEAKYPKMVEFEKYDFFIIISAGRFTENDVKLAKEIQKIKKKFYFVRAKIDRDVEDAEDDERDFNKQKTLETIKDKCFTGLEKLGCKSPQVFLVSSKKLHLYEFHLLEETLERELPDHKRDAFLFAMPNISPEMINKKKKAFQNKIEYFATLSAAGAAVPVPGVSVAVDLAVLVVAVKRYVNGFGLDIQSLERMANYSGVPYEELKSVITSSLAAAEITPDLILKFLPQIGKTGTSMLAEESFRFIPIFGIPFVMSFSLFLFTNPSKSYSTCLLKMQRRFFKKIFPKPQSHRE